MRSALISILSVAMIMILLSSCQGGFTTRQTAAPIHVGAQGLTFRFIDRAPPPTMLEGTETPVVLEVQNQGAFNAQSALWTLSADQGFFEFTGDSDGAISVEGRSKTNPIAGKETVESKVKALDLDPQRQTHDGTITATFCYNYQTNAGINVCIDTDPLNLANRKKVCSQGAVSGSGGQGGPVMIDSIEADMIPEGDYIRPVFNVYISNAGSGWVVDPTKVSLACQPFGATRDLFDVVQVSARLTDTPLDCEPKAFLEEGKAHVKCVATNTFPKALGAYLAPLTITLKYGYTQSISKTLRIERHALISASR